jgi:tetratricopeptide (TPR) repeat protein
MSGGYLRILSIIAVLLTLIGIVMMMPLRATAERNWAMLEFGNFLLLSTELERGTSNLDAVSFNSVQDFQALTPVINRLRENTVRSPYPTSTEWSLGRMQMVVGDLQSAKNSLSLFQTRVIENPLLYSDILMTNRELGDHEAIANFYESNPIPMPLESISETIAGAYISMGGPDAPASVLALRPNDIWATYHRWLQTRREGNAEEVRRYESALVHFPLNAISPNNTVRFDAALKIFPELFEAGIWDLHVLRNVVAFLVWKFAERESVEALLKTLMIRYPNNETWPLYLGELYLRKGQLDDAAAMFLYAHTMNPESTIVKSGIELAIAACAPPTAPCKRLSEIGIGKNDAAPIINIDDDLEFVADSLGINSESLQLGDNLIKNGDFSVWQEDHLEGWRFETYMGGEFDGAVYATGEDDLLPHLPSARIAALRGGRLSDNTMTLGEYLGPEFIANDSQYLVTITYRANDFSDGTALLLLGDYRYENGKIILMEELPPTQNTVTRLRFVTPTATPGTVNLPVIRNWGNGQLWIYSIEVRPIIEEQTNTP